MQGVMSKFIRGFVIAETSVFVKFFIICLVIVVLTYKFINQYVINFPRSIWVLFFPIFLWYSFLFFKIDLNVKGSIGGYYLKGIGIILVFYYLIFFSGFCLVTRIVSGYETPKTVSCRIVGASSSSRNHAVYYEFENRVYRINGYGRVFKELSSLKDFSTVKVRLSVSEGIAKAYFVQDSKIIYSDSLK